MNCHDCGEPEQKGRIRALVGAEERAYCQKHGELRWKLGCDKSAPGWLRNGTGPLYYTGPIENKD